jgi:3-oxoacyl-[acyl-carrier protein] reductase
MAGAAGVAHEPKGGACVDLKLGGRRALVTGASAGIGRAIALELAREGVRLVITGRRADALAEVARAIGSISGTPAAVVVHDALDEGYVEAVASAALDALGAVEILVNNAGGSRPFGRDAGEPQWNEAMTLNFTRHRQLTQRLLPAMIANGWGRIVNITGKSEPEGVNGAFCAKAAVHSWAKGLSREVGRHGITVNCVPPGRVMSDQIRRNYTPEYRAWQSEHEIPVGRYGEPEELADLVVFLASPRAGYITGAVIPVDGGLRRYQF